MSLFLSISLALSLLGPHTVVAQTVDMPVEPYKIVYTATSTLQEAWISKLATCESGDNENAINPKDTDGTPSYSTFQFKVTTFEWLLKKYDIPSAPIFASTTQRAIVRRMINDPDINLKNQFPTCVKILGLPPK